MSFSATVAQLRVLMEFYSTEEAICMLYALYTQATIQFNVVFGPYMEIVDNKKM